MCAERQRKQLNRLSADSSPSSGCVFRPRDHVVARTIRRLAMGWMSIYIVRSGGRMDRRVFVIEAGKAFPVVAGALYLIGCRGSSTSPSAVADVQSTSTVVNSHTHTANVPASDQLHPASTTYTSSTDSGHNHL